MTVQDPPTVRGHIARALVEVTNAKTLLDRKYEGQAVDANLTVTLYQTELRLLQRQLERLLSEPRTI